MKTAWDEPYMVPQKFFQFCKWHLDKPKDPKAPCHFGKLPIEIQELIWGKMYVCHLITCLVINRWWNVKITEMIWNNNDWKSNCRYRLLKCAGQYSLVKPIPEYPPTHRLPWGFYPKEIELNKNLQGALLFAYNKPYTLQPIWEQSSVNGIWDSDDEDVYPGDSAYHTQLEENKELTDALYEPNPSYENDKVQV